MQRPDLLVQNCKSAGAALWRIHCILCMLLAIYLARCQANTAYGTAVKNMFPDLVPKLVEVAPPSATVLASDSDGMTVT